MFKRLAANWVYGGFLSAFVLLFLAFAFLPAEPIALLLLFLHLPVYQIHQFEEHDRDRFRLFMNQTAGRGLEILTTTAVFWINIGLVWGLFSVFLVLAAEVGIGWGLPVVYGTLVNAVIHVAAALKNRQYNPGLVTAIVLFFPLSLLTLLLVSGDPSVTALQQTVGVLVGVGVHVGIVLHCVARARRLRQTG